MAKNKKIPKFKNEDEERDFWAKNDFTDFADQFEPIELDLSKLKLSTESISLRLPSHMLYSLKLMANKRDVPYQSLMKMFLAERIQQEQRRRFT